MDTGWVKLQLDNICDFVVLKDLLQVISPEKDAQTPYAEYLKQFKNLDLTAVAYIEDAVVRGGVIYSCHPECGCVFLQYIGGMEDVSVPMLLEEALRQVSATHGTSMPILAEVLETEESVALWHSMGFKKACIEYVVPMTSDTLIYDYSLYVRTGDSSIDAARLLSAVETIYKEGYCLSTDDTDTIALDVIKAQLVGRKEVTLI